MPTGPEARAAELQADTHTTYIHACVVIDKCTKLVPTLVAEILT